MARPFTFADTLEVVSDALPDQMAIITDESSPLMIADGPYLACIMPMRRKGDEQ